MKREGISTLFIHGYPWALSYLVFRSFALIFDCLKMVCMCECFENVFEEMPCLRRPMYLTRV